MSVIVSGNEIVLNGTVGDLYGGWYDDDCFSASSVIAALAKVGHNNDVVIRINSGGGIATEGSAIHAALARHGGKKNVVVEGIAASAASIIAMAGDDVSFALGAVMMVHLPSGFTVGTVSDHEMQISALTALGQAMASIYAAKSGQTAEACLADMKAETWMTADDAIAKGYADRLANAASDNAGDSVEIIEPAPFDYTLYAHAPHQMVAMAKDRKWNARAPRAATETLPAGSAAKEPATPLPEEQDEMPTEAEIQARIDAATTAARTAAKVEHEAAAHTKLSRADASEIAKLCTDGGVPAMAASLLAEGVSVADAKTRIGAAGEIKEMVALARKSHPHIAADAADKFLAEGKTVTDVRATLFDQMVAKQAEHETRGTHTNNLPDPKTGDKAAARAKSRASMEVECKRSGLSPKKEG